MKDSKDLFLQQKVFNPVMSYRHLSLLNFEFNFSNIIPFKWHYTYEFFTLFMSYGLKKTFLIVRIPQIQKKTFK